MDRAHRLAHLCIHDFLAIIRQPLQELIVVAGLFSPLDVPRPHDGLEEDCLNRAHADGPHIHQPGDLNLRRVLKPMLGDLWGHVAGRAAHPLACSGGPRPHRSIEINELPGPAEAHNVRRLDVQMYEACGVQAAHDGHQRPLDVPQLVDGQGRPFVRQMQQALLQRLCPELEHDPQLLDFNVHARSVGLLRVRDELHEAPAQIHATPS
mmetsp:Transcript_98928/g.248082  ORF Transcript_98928/g.248082 Transcript_98928/m.248082 type:complete len:208 (-) Transcript_98928:684-1307(-)